MKLSNKYQISIVDHGNNIGTKRLLFRTIVISTVVILSSFMFIQYGAMAQVVDWIAESGKIYYLGGNVGIGTQNPSAKVDVHDVNGNSVQLQTATGEGLYISRATKSGILIDSAGDNGISSETPVRMVYASEKPTSTASSFKSLLKMVSTFKTLSQAAVCRLTQLAETECGSALPRIMVFMLKTQPTKAS